MQDSAESVNLAGAGSLGVAAIELWARGAEREVSALVRDTGVRTTLLDGPSVRFALSPFLGPPAGMNVLVAPGERREAEAALERAEWKRQRASVMGPAVWTRGGFDVRLQENLRCAGTPPKAFLRFAETFPPPSADGT